MPAIDVIGAAVAMLAAVYSEHPEFHPSWWTALTADDASGAVPPASRPERPRITGDNVVAFPRRAVVPRGRSPV